jgi:hypothetical protein
MKHQSRLGIMSIFLAAKGKPLLPKQVFAAQTPPMNMKHPAIRKLLRAMLRDGLRRNTSGYYLLEGSNLTENEINTAPREEHYAEAKLVGERHGRQRHTIARDLIWGWERLIREHQPKPTHRHTRAMLQGNTERPENE